MTTAPDSMTTYRLYNDICRCASATCPERDDCLRSLAWRHPADPDPWVPCSEDMNEGHESLCQHRIPMRGKA